jgi:TFIIF-interacting CTD phosphatase-like protein
LDETLLHFQSKEEVGEDGEEKFLIRPFAYEFLEEMAQYYEIIIFTAAT